VNIGGGVYSSWEELLVKKCKGEAKSGNTEYKTGKKGALKTMHQTGGQLGGGENAKPYLVSGGILG